jgi:dTDP-4-amino-4,6-dideoxygalactose transaminase
MRIPFLRPEIREEDIEEVVRVLRGGWLVLGEETKKFETAFAEYLGASDAVFVNSCTAAIQISLVMAGVGEGDEVIVTPLTYVSSVTPILHCGAKPVFVDVEHETGLIDCAKMRGALTAKTKAIIPVHLYGQMAHMRELQRIAGGQDLAIIEDAAHAIEAERDGVRPGGLSTTACFSFHTAKNICAGTGGMIVTNDSVLTERARLLRRDGVQAGTHRRMIELGHRAFCTDFQAALLRSQLHRIDAQWEARKRAYERYAEAFRANGIRFNPVVPGSKHSYHMIVIFVQSDRRDAIREELSRAGVETSIHYDPVHLEPYFQKTFGFRPGDFPIAESFGFSAITLPLYPSLTEEEQNYVIEQVLKMASTPVRT